MEVENKIKHLAIIGNGASHKAIMVAIRAMRKFEKVKIVNIDNNKIYIQARVGEMKFEVERLLPLLPYSPPLNRRERRKLKRNKK